MGQIELIEEMLNDYFHMQRRDVDNSDCITPAYYVEEYARIDRQRNDAYDALNVIKNRLGIDT